MNSHQNHLLKMVEVDENFKKRRIGRNRKKKFGKYLHLTLLAIVVNKLRRLEGYFKQCKQNPNSRDCFSLLIL